MKTKSLMQGKQQRGDISLQLRSGSARECDDRIRTIRQRIASDSLREDRRIESILKKSMRFARDLLEDREAA